MICERTDFKRFGLGSVTAADVEPAPRNKKPRVSGGLVPLSGLEPEHVAITDFESAASTDSATEAVVATGIERPAQLVCS